VYYRYKINGEPTCYKKFCFNEFLTYLPPGWAENAVIDTQGVPTNYKFTVRYEYDNLMNNLDGLANALSPLVPPPLDNLPLLMDIILLAAADELDETKLGEMGIGYLIGQLKDTNSRFHKAIVSKVTEKYGDAIAQKLSKELASELVELPMAFYKGLQWAWNNLNADAYHEFDITVIDPPSEYTVEGEPMEHSLYFGGIYDTSSTLGEGNITITIDNKGNGEYSAHYEINTKDTHLNDVDFSSISKIQITEYGEQQDDTVMGTVEIQLYFTDQASSKVYEYLLSDIGLTESIIQSYFTRLTSYEAALMDDHISITGSGILPTGSHEDEIENTMIITEETIQGNYYAKGTYTENSGNAMVFNASFGPRLNIPLSNTQLQITLPNEPKSISPAPDASSQKTLYWSQTPAEVFITANRVSQTPGFEIIVMLMAFILVAILLKKKTIT
jgi:hypothetical protein